MKSISAKKLSAQRPEILQANNEPTKVVDGSTNIRFEKKIFKLYSLDKYDKSNKFIENNFKLHGLEELENELEKNKGYHMRIHSDQNYIFFGDVDGYDKSFDEFSILLKDFLNEYCFIQIEQKDISYSENKCKTGSYHYSIPSLYTSCNALKQFHVLFQKKYNLGAVIDTTIYSDHWFRYPNQHKESILGTEHVIMNGKMRDFIVEYIPETVVMITIKSEPAVIKEKIYDKHVNNKNAGQSIINKISADILDKLLACLDEKRFAKFDSWFQLKYIVYNCNNTVEAFDLFCKFGKVGKYVTSSKEELLIHWNSTDYNLHFDKEILYHYARHSIYFF